MDTSRDHDPLIQSPDAIVLDNSYLTLDEQFQFVMSKVGQRVASGV
jgi:cytidylate kinase